MREYRVTYYDRYYGERNLYVQARDTEQAKQSALFYLGYTPPGPITVILWN
jgi:hypothetical protein